MLQLIKNFIKTKPKLYDFFNERRKLNNELDLWLDHFSKSRNRTIDFIQVGANDGLRWDPIRRFIIRDNWNGVLIEPLRQVYSMLLNNYSYVKKSSLKFENCAISEKEGSIEFWSYTDKFLNSLSIEDRLFYLRKSSLDKGQAEKPLTNIENPTEHIRCYKTPSKPLAQIISKYFPNNNIDLIFIDAEGFDDHVIRTIDFAKCKPTAIIYENHNLGIRNEAIEDFLSKKGYSIKRIGGDTVAELNANT
jgi:FkbM family methyltransferase